MKVAVVCYLVIMLMCPSGSNATDNVYVHVCICSLSVWIVLGCHGDGVLPPPHPPLPVPPLHFALIETLDLY